MSAFQLPETHIGAIAKFAIQNNRGASFRCYFNRSTREYDFEDICQVLADECFRSVRSRYPSGPLPGPVSAGDGPVPFTMRQSQYATLAHVDLLKACASYAYQSCETDNWEETEAYALVSAIERNAIRSLPGFDASPAWDIDYTAAEQAKVEREAREAHQQAEINRAAYINSQY